MTKFDYPYSAYGVEARTDATGWVLLDSIHNTHDAATKHRQSLTGRHGLEADDLRVVALSISRKGDAE